MKDLLAESASTIPTICPNRSSATFSADAAGARDMLEAAGLMRDWMFANHKPPRLVSLIAPDNVASAHVASKLGAVWDRTVVQMGAVQDVWLYKPPPEGGVN